MVLWKCSAYCYIKILFFPTILSPIECYCVPDDVLGVLWGPCRVCPGVCDRVCGEGPKHPTAQHHHDPGPECHIHARLTVQGGQPGISPHQPEGHSPWDTGLESVDMKQCPGSTTHTHSRLECLCLQVLLHTLAVECVKMSHFLVFRSVIVSCCTTNGIYRLPISLLTGTYFQSVAQSARC